MGNRIEVKSDITGANEEIEGSDNRFNVSSRSDSRFYYNSRDKGQSYSMTWAAVTPADGEYSFYLKNTSTSKTLVIHSIGVNADDLAKFKLWTVTGTAANGASVTPTNLNLSSSNAAAVTALHDGGSPAISGLTQVALIDQASVVANGHEEMRVGDTLRLGQNDAIALELDVGTSTPETFGVCFFYFE